MKLVCSKANLLNGVQIVSKAVPSKTTMSILECILVDTTNGEIKLTANDMELGIETTIEGQIVEKGIIALDAKIFLEIVRKLPDSDMKQMLLLRPSLPAKRQNSLLLVNPAKIFPIFPQWREMTAL